MNYIIILLAIFCGFKIFKGQGQSRYDWLICSMLLFSSSITIIDKPQIPVHRFFILCYWASVLYKKEYRRGRMPLKTILIIYVVGLVLIGVNSPYLTAFYKLYKPFNVLLESALTIMLAVYGTNNVRVCSANIVKVLYFVSLYGIVTFIIRSNPIHELVSSAFNQGYLSAYYWGNRIRINSTWSHPISYGLICCYFFYLLLADSSEKKRKILLFFLFVNVFICGSRTAIATWLLMGCVILLTKYNVSHALHKVVSVLLILVPIYFFIPFVQDKVDSVVLTAMGDDSVGGSSMEMREGQTEASHLIFLQSPLWGHGYDYIQEQMGFGSDNWTGDNALYGLESLYYILIIERGLVGLVLQCLLWSSIFIYAYRYRKVLPSYSSLLCCILVGFIFFAFSTGALDTSILTYFFVGYMIRHLNTNMTLDNNRMLIQNETTNH